MICSTQSNGEQAVESAGAEAFCAGRTSNRTCNVIARRTDSSNTCCTSSSCTPDVAELVYSSSLPSSDAERSHGAVVARESKWRTAVAGAHARARLFFSPPYTHFTRTDAKANPPIHSPQAE